MHSGQKYGVIAIVAAPLVFLGFYLTGAIGPLEPNLAFVVDTSVGGLFAAGVTLIAAPLLQKRNEDALIDDLQNPEVRLSIQKARKEEVEKLILKPETAKMLEHWPECKAFVEGLALIEERDVAYYKEEARKTPLRESLMRHIGATPTMKEMAEMTRVQTVMWSAIDLMTLPKGARMLRKAEPMQDSEKQQKRVYHVGLIPVADGTPIELSNGGKQIFDIDRMEIGQGDIQAWVNSGYFCLSTIASPPDLAGFYLYVKRR